MRKAKVFILTAILALTSCLIGCEKHELTPDQLLEKYKDTKLSDLKKDDVKHILNDDQISRSNAIQRALAEIDPSTPEQWIDDFSRDNNPESEIQIWEGIVFAYEKFNKNHSVKIDSKKEVQSLLLFRAAVPEEQVLKSLDTLRLKTLSLIEVKKILSYYRIEPKPIVVKDK